MAKSADAFRTISEVADWLETPAHVLRFWESKFAQVKPVKRAGGRRYYRPTDMLLLGGIKKLLHSDGMTIKGVQKLLREQGVKHVSEHSQPLDDLTKDAEDVVTLEASDRPTEAPTDTAPSEPAPPAPTEERPEADADLAASSAVETPVDAELADEPDVSEEDKADDIPVMPSFAHRAVPANDAPEAAPAAPPAPKPTAITVPDDPADDVASDPGVLSKLGGLRTPVSDDMADRLGHVLERLRHSAGGNASGQGG